MALKPVTACMIALNEAEFIGHNLRSHLALPWIDQFVIVEGAVDKYVHAAGPDSHSNDGTIDIIKDIQKNHPQGQKIELITGKWRDKEQQRNAYLEKVRNGWILLIDADEFYREEEITKVVETAQIQDLDCIVFPHRHFWHDFHHYAYSVGWCKTQLRFSKFKKGWKYNVHYTLSDDKGRNLQWDGAYRNTRAYASNCVNLAYKKEDLAGGILPLKCWIYHCGYARDRQYMVDKLAFYRKRDKKDNASDDKIKAEVEKNSSWFDPRWFQGLNCDPATVFKYGGPWPSAIEAHPRFQELIIKD